MYKLSIIIPVYNVEKYIDETLQSILKQYHRDIEIICVNDGSTDNSLSCLQTYSNQGMIRIINQKNQGVSVARNRGITESTGEYILFLDGDDLMEPYFIEKFMKEEYSSDLVIGNRYYLEEIKKSASNYVCASFSYQDFLIYSISNKIIYWNMGGFLVRRKLLLENDILFPEGCISAEDLDFFMKALIISSKVKSVSYYFFSYRRSHQGATTQSSSYLKIKNQIVVYSKYVDFFMSYPIIQKYFYQSIIRSINQIGNLKDKRAIIYTTKYVREVLKKIQYTDTFTQIYRVFWRIFGFYFGSKIVSKIKKCVKLFLTK